MTHHNKEPQPFAPNRRDFMKLLGAAGLGLTLSQFDSIRTLAAADETLNDILGVAATAEALAVTLNGAVAANAASYDNGRGLSPMIVRYVRAIQAEEQIHYAFLTAAGAKPATTTFTVPQNLAGILSDSRQLFTFVLSAEDIFIAAYTAAGQRFAQYNRPDLVKVAYQIMGVECEHRVLISAALGNMPPNDRAFQKAMFQNVIDAVPMVQNLGLLGTSNPAATLRYEEFSRNIDYTGIRQTQP